MTSVLNPQEQAEEAALLADKREVTARLREINRKLRTLFNRGYARDRRKKEERA